MEQGEWRECTPHVNTHMTPINHNNWRQQPQCETSMSTEKALDSCFLLSTLSSLHFNLLLPATTASLPTVTISQLDHCKSLLHVFLECSEMTCPLRAVLFLLSLFLHFCKFWGSSDIPVSFATFPPTPLTFKLKKKRKRPYREEQVGNMSILYLCP